MGRLDTFPFLVRFHRKDLCKNTKLKSDLIKYEIINRPLVEHFWRRVWILDTIQLTLTNNFASLVSPLTQQTVFNHFASDLHFDQLFKID